MQEGRGGDNRVRRLETTQDMTDTIQLPGSWDFRNSHLYPYRRLRRLVHLGNMSKTENHELSTYIIVP